MTRTKRNTIHTLFKATHANRDIPSLSATWRQGVMDTIIQDASLDAPMARLAPRFTMAAAAISAIGLVAGFWAIPELTTQVGSAYTSQLLDLASSAWSLL